MPTQSAPDWLDRARLLKETGAYGAVNTEIQAVHALIFPDKELVCLTCRGELGKAFYAILRALATAEYLATQAAPTTSISSSQTSMKKSVSTARFERDDIQYTPFGLGVTYSNANLTDSAARTILANDSDAAGLFAVLPPDAPAEDEAGEGGEDTTTTDKPAVTLSKANKEQLRTFYREELGQEPAEELQNDDLRDAIAGYRKQHEAQ